MPLTLPMLIFKNIFMWEALERGCQLITLGRSAGERAVCSPKEQINRLTRPFSVKWKLNIQNYLFIIQKTALFF